MTVGMKVHLTKDLLSTYLKMSDRKKKHFFQHFFNLNKYVPFSNFHKNIIYIPILLIQMLNEHGKGKNPTFVIFYHK